MFRDSFHIVLAVIVVAGMGFLPCHAGLVERSHQAETDLSESSRTIAMQRFAVHAEGLQWLGMANTGEYANPDEIPMWIPKLEYPGGSGTIFLFSGGLWVGAIKNSILIVSTCTDGDNGTGEFGPLEFGTQEDQADPDIQSIGWLEKTTNDVSQDDQDIAKQEGRYLGSGTRGIDDDGDWTLADDLNGDGLPSADWDGPEADANNDGVFDYDPEPGIDEDPAGDISADNIDNDHDGLYDQDDPDSDGDLVPGDLDDDGDGMEDEDDLATAGQELITAYVDTCMVCIHDPDPDGFTPLGVRVLQHSYQWSGSTGRDSILMEFEVTNIGDTVLEDVCLGTFFDFDIGHVTQSGPDLSTDDITYYFDDIQMAVGADDDGDDGLLDAREFGIRVEETPLPEVQATYKNFSRLFGEDPEDNLAKYTMMASGERDPDQLEPSDWRFLLAFGPLGELNPGETLPVRVTVLNWPLDQAADPATRPVQLTLGNVRPNPSSGQAELRLSLSRKALVEITIHDLAGQEIAVLENGWLNRGEHVATWSGTDSSSRDVSSGLYFIRVRTGREALSRPIVLIH